MLLGSKAVFTVYCVQNLYGGVARDFQGHAVHVLLAVELLWYSIVFFPALLEVVHGGTSRFLFFFPELIALRSQVLRSNIMDCIATRVLLASAKRLDFE